MTSKAYRSFELLQFQINYLITVCFILAKRPPKPNNIFFFAVVFN